MDTDKTAAQASGGEAAFSLDDIDLVTLADEGVWMHIQHPATGEFLYLDNDQSKPMRLKIFGRDGDKFRAHSKAVLERMSRVEAKFRNSAKVPDDIAKDMDAQWVSGLIAGWENIKLSGALVEYSADAAKELAKKLPWLRRQVDEFNKVPANFLQEHSTATSAA